MRRNKTRNSKRKSGLLAAYILSLLLVLGVAQAAYYEQATPSSYKGTTSNASTYPYMPIYNYNPGFIVGNSSHLVQITPSNMSSFNVSVSPSCLLSDGSVNMSFYSYYNQTVSFSFTTHTIVGCLLNNGSINVLYTQNNLYAGTPTADGFASPDGINSYYVDNNYNTGSFCRINSPNNCQVYASTSNATNLYAAMMYDVRMFWYYEPVINVTIIDEETKSVITEQINYIIYSDNELVQGNTTTGSLQENLNDINYFVQLGNDNYTERTFRVTLPFGSQTNNYTYALLKNGSGSYVRFTVLSESYNTLPGAVVNAQIKNNNNYYEVQDCVTDGNGECLLYLQTFTATYRFVTEYQNIVRTGLDTVLSRETYNIIINTQESNLQSVLEIPGVASTLLYSGAGLFTYTVNDASNNVQNGELVIYRRYGGTLYEINRTSFSGSSFTIAASADDITLGDEIVAKGYVDFNGISILTHQTTVPINKQGTALAGGTLLLFLGLAFTIVFIFAFDPIAPMIAFGFLIIVANLVGLINFGGGVVVAVIIVIAIGAYRMRSI